MARRVFAFNSKPNFLDIENALKSLGWPIVVHVSPAVDEEIRAQSTVQHEPGKITWSGFAHRKDAPNAYMVTMHRAEEDLALGNYWIEARGISDELTEGLRKLSAAMPKASDIGNMPAITDPERETFVPLPDELQPEPVQVEPVDTTIVQATGTAKIVPDPDRRFEVTGEVGATFTAPPRPEAEKALANLPDVKSPPDPYEDTPAAGLFQPHPMFPAGAAAGLHLLLQPGRAFGRELTRDEIAAQAMADTVGCRLLIPAQDDDGNDMDPYGVLGAQRKLDDPRPLLFEGTLRECRAYIDALVRAVDELGGNVAFMDVRGLKTMEDSEPIDLPDADKVTVDLPTTSFDGTTAERGGFVNDTRELTDERGSGYGHPNDNHNCTMDLWRVFAARRYGDPNVGPQCAEDICWFNIFQKISRQANAFKQDNLADIRGYSLNIEDLDEDSQFVGTAPEGYQSPLVPADAPPLPADDDGPGITLDSKSVGALSHTVINVSNAAELLDTLGDERGEGIIHQLVKRHGPAIRAALATERNGGARPGFTPDEPEGRVIAGIDAEPLTTADEVDTVAAVGRKVRDERVHTVHDAPTFIGPETPAGNGGKIMFVPRAPLGEGEGEVPMDATPAPWDPNMHGVIDLQAEPQADGDPGE